MDHDLRGEEIAYIGTNAAGEFGTHYVTVFGYPSGEPLVNERPKYVRRVLLRPKSMQAFIGGLFWMDSYASRGGRMPELILPFVPGARQDRLNDEGDYLFTAKGVAEMINLRHCPRVTILDPHSEVIAALIDNCLTVHASDCVYDINAATDYACVISPDAGAEKRAGAVARTLKRPLVHGWKTRDVATGNITGFGVDVNALVAWKGQPVLVVDDICDGGGTFLGLAGVLEEVGVLPDLFVTHGLFTKGTRDILQHYKKVYCTDSVVLNRPGINITQICQRLIKGESK